MIVQDGKHTTLSIPETLKVLSIAGGTLGILIVALAVLAYLPDHPDFSPLTTYLSDIGDTAGWPQVLFNSGTLISSPIRFLVLALLVLRLSQFGTGRRFAFAVLTIGALSALGTILMTAVPFSVGPTIHKMGIPLYFFGVVPLQIIIGLREWRLKEVPRPLPVISFVFAGAYGVFFTLMVLYEMELVGRGTPVIWQWLGFALSIVWVFAHGIVLGRREWAWGSEFAGTVAVVET
jgi:hypothetical membrane protein